MEYFSFLRVLALHDVSHSGKTTKSVQICNNCKRKDYVRSDQTSLTRDRSIFEQQSDLKIKGQGISFLSLSEEEKVHVCYHKNQCALMRKWRPRDASVENEWQVHPQIAVPTCLQAISRRSHSWH